MDETQSTAARPAHDLTPGVDLTLHHGAGPFRNSPAALRLAAAALQSCLSRWREHPGLARAGASW